MSKQTTGKFATHTVVDPEETLMEIRRTLKRYDATNMTTVEGEKFIYIMFEMQHRRVKFVVPMPNKDSEEFIGGSGSKYYSKGDFVPEKYEQGIRSRWRALLLVIKAKLESYDVGIEDFQDAFMAQILLPDGQTMSEWAKPQIAKAYETDGMPPLLVSGL